MPDEEQIEEMLAACQECAEATPERFTDWELLFLDEVADDNEDGHLSDQQIEKLGEIYAERCHA